MRVPSALGGDTRRTETEPHLDLDFLGLLRRRGVVDKRASQDEATSHGSSKQCLQWGLSVAVQEQAKIGILNLHSSKLNYIFVCFGLIYC